MQLSDAKGSFLFASCDALLNDPFASLKVSRDYKLVISCFCMRFCISSHL